MIKQTWLHNVDRLIANNRLLAIGFAVLLAWNVVDTIANEFAKRETRITYVPLVGGTGLWVGAGKASEEYLRAMARYITSMLGNSTAGSIRPQLQELLVLFPPEDIGKAQTAFFHLADDRERFPSIAYQVVWNGKPAMKVYDNRMIQVQTIKSELVNGNVTKEEPTFYCIHYRIDDTQFHLTGVKEISGNGDDLCINEEKNAQTSAAAAPAAH